MWSFGWWRNLLVPPSLGLVCAFEAGRRYKPPATLHDEGNDEQDQGSVENSDHADSLYRSPLASLSTTDQASRQNEPVNQPLSPLFRACFHNNTNPAQVWRAALANSRIDLDQSEPETAALEVSGTPR